MPEVVHGSLRGRGDENSERTEGAEGHVVERGEVCFDQRKGFDDGFGFFDCLAIEQEDYAFAVSSCPPLLDAAVEIELNRFAHFGGHHLHHLIAGYAWFDCESGEDVSCLWRGGSLGEERDGCQEQENDPKSLHMQRM
jgi:hypothetical protein